MREIILTSALQLYKYSFMHLNDYDLKVELQDSFSYKYKQNSRNYLYTQDMEGQNGHLPRAQSLFACSSIAGQVMSKAQCGSHKLTYILYLLQFDKNI